MQNIHMETVAFDWEGAPAKRRNVGGREKGGGIDPYLCGDIERDERGRWGGVSSAPVFKI